MTRFLSRWIRYTKMGIAMVAAATRKRGARNDMTRGSGLGARRSSDAHQPFSCRQIAEQQPIERLRGVRQRVVDAVLGKLRRQRLGVLANQLAVLRRERLRHD